MAILAVTVAAAAAEVRIPASQPLAAAAPAAGTASAPTSAPSPTRRDRQASADASADERLLAVEYLGLEPSRREVLVARLMVANSARYRHCYANETVERVAEAFAAWVGRTSRVQRRPVPEAFANYLLLTCP